MSPPPEAEPDARLVERCLAGDEDAWHTLFREHQPGLLMAARRLLGPGKRDDVLAEELAARVWCSLVERERRRLRAYDPRRGRLSTFLASLARRELQLHYRSIAPGEESGKRAATAPDARNDPYFLSEVFLAEFMPTLSPRERAFLLEDLLSRSPPTRLTPANRRKLRQRILDKLLAFLSRP